MAMWILILFAHAGPMAEGNSNALSSSGVVFHSEQSCKLAGEAARAMANGTVKKISYVCVRDR